MRQDAVSRALYTIHRPGTYYAGLTSEGMAHLLAGGSIGPDDMSIDAGMNSHPKCVNCPAGQGWPCDTVKLLLEAGVISAFRPVTDELACES